MNNFIKWTPIAPPPKDLSFVSLTNNGGKLTIVLAEMDDDKLLEIKFKGVMAYQVVDEGARLKTLYEQPAYRRFVTSINSSYLHWFHLESRRMFEDWDLKHYSMGNIDNIIDVIAGDNVEAQWI